MPATEKRLAGLEVATPTFPRLLIIKLVAVEEPTANGISPPGALIESRAKGVAVAMPILP